MQIYDKLDLYKYVGKYSVYMGCIYTNTKISENWYTFRM